MVRVGGKATCCPFLHLGRRLPRADTAASPQPAKAHAIPNPSVGQPAEAWSESRWPGRARPCRREGSATRRKPSSSRWWPLWADNFESLQPAAFVFGNVDVAFGIHGGPNGIKQLAREEKPGAAADGRYDLASRVIQDIDFPLILIDDINELLAGVAGKLDRDRRGPPADLLHQGTRRE